MTREEMKSISEKWGKLGLLDGLKGHISDNIAQLYECDMSYKIPEDEIKEIENLTNKK